MQNAIKYIRDELATVYSSDELQSISRLLISKITGFSFTEILVNKNTIISEHQRELLNIYLEKLKSRMPVQYVLGETEFCGLNFYVDETVLIPRPETEELVTWIANEAKAKSTVLDVGTGSGCIAVSLKCFLPDSEIYACDIDELALLTAARNAEMNSLKVNFFKMDVLHEIKSDRQYDIIVSNPPYIPLQEATEILPQVKHFEPHQALFVPDEDPLVFYRKIADFASQHLYPDGKLFFEVHRDFGKMCVDMLQNMGFANVQLKKDIFANDRMIQAEKPGEKKQD